MDRLDELANQSIYVIREAYARCRRLAVLWSGGKDSTALLWLCRRALPGDIRVPVVLIQTSRQFPEIDALCGELARQWDLRMLVVRGGQAAPDSPDSRSRDACCRALLGQPLGDAVRRHALETLLDGLRGDEHAADGPLRFLEGDGANGPQGRARHVHPLGHWRELDVWTLIRREGIPVAGLYFARDARRYRSAGCRCCRTSVESAAGDVDAVIEELRRQRPADRPAGDQEIEDAQVVQRLRALGYL